MQTERMCIEDRLKGLIVQIEHLEEQQKTIDSSLKTLNLAIKNALICDGPISYQIIHPLFEEFKIVLSIVERTTLYITIEAKGFQSKKGSKRTCITDIAILGDAKRAVLVFEKLKELASRLEYSSKSGLLSLKDKSLRLISKFV